MDTENTTSNIPRFDLVDQQRNHLAGGGDQGSLTSGSSRLWEKGDYLALREVTLSYTLNDELLNNYFNTIRLYITGSNLKYFTKFTGSSPEPALSDNPNEGQYIGRDIGRFPLPKTFTLGLSLTF